MCKLSQEEMVVNPQGQGDGVYRNQTDHVEELEQVYLLSLLEISLSNYKVHKKI